MNGGSSIQAGDMGGMPYHRFSQQAMATVFEIFVEHDDHEYARQAAFAAFDELNRLENELSRYDETSDISRINHSPVESAVAVGLDTLHCLQLAEQFFYKTNGAFDVTSGRKIDKWKNGITANNKDDDDEPDSTEYGLSLDVDRCTAARLHEDVLLDLGGIGKGYALDGMKKVLNDWDIGRAMMHSGWSTVLALSPPRNHDGWRLSLSHPETEKRIDLVALSHQAISGSGLQKGNHIIDPRTGLAVSHTSAAWVMAADAAIADALSTSCMILPKQQRDELLHTELQMGCWIVEQDEPVHSSLHFRQYPR